MLTSSIIRQKGKSQNVLKTKHGKFSQKQKFLTPDTHTHVCALGGTSTHCWWLTNQNNTSEKVKNDLSTCDLIWYKGDPNVKPAEVKLEGADNIQPTLQYNHILFSLLLASTLTYFYFL